MFEFLLLNIAISLIRYPAIKFSLLPSADDISTLKFGFPKMGCAGRATADSGRAAISRFIALNSLTSVAYKGGGQVMRVV